MSRVYVYAILRGPAAPATISGRRIEFAGAGPILAAVERVETARPVSEQAVVTQHAIVQRLCRTYSAVLPARFGALLEERQLTRILKTRRAVLEQSLDLVDARVQMTLRFDTAKPPAKPRPRQPRTGTAYLQQRREAAAASLPALAADMTRAVGGIAKAEAVDSRPGAGQVAIFHLIDRRDVRRYRSKVAGVTKHDADGVVQVSGPWPPFAFTPDLWS